MKKFIVIDYTLGTSWMNETKEEIIEALGYDPEETDVLEDIFDDIRGEFEIIQVSENGDLEWLLMSEGE